MREKLLKFASYLLPAVIVVLLIMTLSMVIGDKILGVQATKVDSTQVVSETETGDVYFEIDAIGLEVSGATFLQAQDYTNSTNGSDEYILPGSATSLLDENDLTGMTAKELCYARNELFARHGYIFKSQELNDYFNSKSWYAPDLNYSFDSLSDIEKNNVDLIVNYQNNNNLNYTVS